MMGNWQLLLPVLVISLVHCNEDNNILPNFSEALNVPTWGYKCIPDKGCQRTDGPVPLNSTFTSSGLFENVDLCRTVCGRFGGLWPRPVTAAISMQTVKIHPNFLRFDLIDAPAETRSLLIEMTNIMTGNLIAECEHNVTEFVDTPVVVFISVKSPEVSLTWDTDEQYMLDVQTREGRVTTHINAETVFGARHALEAFSQLVAADKSDLTENHQCGLRLVTGAKIRDRPVYKHRGFLLDTSRNFIPLKDIRRMIDGMAATKMNVFHWHVTDSHSFPLESTRVPQFTRYGAYSLPEVYLVEEVRTLIHYALVRGVRVVIEIDAPAHAGNGWQWGKDFGYGDLAVCVNAQPWRNLCVQPPCGQLNPANEHMYSVLKELYKDIAEILPKPQLFHVGGDEVCLSCWNTTQEITSYMKSNKMETNVDGFMALWGEFHQKSLKAWDEAVEATGERSQQPVIIWSSELTQPARAQKYLDKNRYVIEVWERQDNPLLSQLIRLGYRVISVPKDVWYLDHGFWGKTIYSNWRRMYHHTVPRDDSVLGGEVAMWSEYVDTNDLDGRVWPRVAAVAERLWADPSSPASAAEPRMQRLRSRLVSRGLKPDAIAPRYCAYNDAKCL